MGEPLNPILRADSLGRSFGVRQVLKAATLHAHAGRITLLLGRNGCGKSTLMRLITGQLRADYGAVHFASKVHLRPRLAELARDGLFFLPDCGLLSPYLTLEQHLQLCGADAGARVLLERTGLWERRDRFGRELSPGERRRANLALVQLRAPTCLLADEPFLGVAPLDSEIITSFLRAQKERGTAIIISGHEIHTLLDVADDVVWMSAGTTHALGSVRDAQRHDQFKREYLGVR